MKYFAFTIDLELDYAGCLNQNYIFEDINKIEEVLFTLTSLGVKITVFTVGKIFEEYPKVIKLFENYDCEFEAHSYSHDFKNPDSEFEIKKSREAYFNYFKKYPIGYRAPRGKISQEGIKILEKYGFRYDTSIFPSYFPNPLKYLLCNKEMHALENSYLLEIPVTPFTPFRFTLCASFIKLFGIRIFLKLSQVFNLPDVICFDSHLHDFIIKEKSFNRLSILWKSVYARNKFQGLNYCIQFLTYIKKRGYEFCYMSDLYRIGERRILSEIGQRA